MRNIVLIFILLSQAVFSQKISKIDSLKSLLEKTQNPNTRIDVKNELAWELRNSKQEDAEKYVVQALEESKKTQYFKGMGEAYKNKASIEMNSSRLLESASNLDSALQIWKVLLHKDPSNKNFLEMESRTYNNFGLVYKKLEKLNVALDYYLKSLKIAEKISDKKLISICFVNIGSVYKDIPDQNLALEYYRKANKISEELNDLETQLASFHNIGIIFSDKKLFDSARWYLKKSLKLKMDLKNRRGISISYNSLGNLFLNLNQVDSALWFFNQSLKIKSEFNDKKGIANTLSSIGDCYLKQNKLKEALITYQQAFQYGKESKYFIEIQLISVQLSKVYEKLGDYKSCVEYLKIEKEVSDSITKNKKVEEITKLRLNFEFDKKEALLLLESEKQDAIIKKQKIVTISLFLGIILVLALLIISYKAFIIKKKSNLLLQKYNTEIINRNQEILLQNEIITKSKKHIEDSIRYAHKIQKAVLPNIGEMQDWFERYFILYLPRDIVSGDFYWAQPCKHHGEQHVFFLVADCTGHGVPGAFMSMLGIAFLNEIVKENEVLPANQYLEILRNKIKSALQQTGKEGEAQDGMDISFCIYHTSIKVLEFALANHNLYYINDKQLKVFKGDKNPIGIYRKERPFTRQTIDLQEGDAVYISSDGYVSQFGGESNEKYKSERFKNLLMKAHHLDINEQKDYFYHDFFQWKGSNEQIDDVLVMGLKF